MKTIFDTNLREELINRINSLNDKSAAQWGKMNVYQMLKHCSQWSETMLRNKKHNRVFIGRLIGKLILKQVIKDDNPMRRNTPTISEFVITGNGDIETEKKNLIALIREHAFFSHDHFMHPFFGKMTKEQIGILAYKHMDHHLRQFNS